VLVEEGKPGHEFFLIVNGNASVKRGKKEIAKLGPGQYFGELALLDRGPRSASVVAKNDMKCSSSASASSRASSTRCRRWPTSS